MIGLSTRSLLAAVALCAAASAASAQKVRIETEAGAIVVQLAPDKAPVTVANFLRYVDEHR
jgi:peptidyl-prolyl cis-trans isomerase A (cyclophilin A)